MTYVVAIRILNKRQGVEGNFVHELDPLALRCMVNAAL
jgi:hypothetical protein